MSIITREVNSTPIAQRVEDGYVNLTKMAKASGKLIADYLRLSSTKEFLEALSSDMGFPISASDEALNNLGYSGATLIQIKKGGANAEQGTWGSPQVAIHCAQWCSPQFAVLVSKWVFEWMSTGKTPSQASEPETESVAPALPSADRFTILKEAVEIGNQLGGFDDRQRMLLKDQLMNLLMQERLLAADSIPVIEAAEPEQPKRLEVPISDRCLDLGFHPNTKQLLKIGQVAAAFYRGRHGRPPQKREQFVGGTTRLVNVYTADDLSILDSAIQSVMGD
jgi:hypothetical protein